MKSFKPRRLFPAALAALVLLGQISMARAAELVMFEQEYCEWCEAWHEEIGGIYPKTDEGKLLPLRQVDIDQARPADLTEIRAVRFTPTFVVLDKGREVGRILGYPGEANFYWLLNELIAKLGKKQAGLAD